ncbi:MAG: gliding motility-associated ABC transporter substrate-binding protein GldG [Croceitalea sp.]|nr:gliding motility-associated ABC transporter substrate-binding protein GldG [Croceitalea sp.]
MKNHWFKKAGLSFVLVLFVNLISHYLYKRFDLTEDQRYTLSEAALQSANKFNGTVTIDVLLDGNLPAEFSRLRTETLLLLEQFKSKNQGISVNFINPLAESGPRENTIAELQSLGLTPANITIEEDGKVTQELVFPWAMVNYNNQTVRVPLLKNKLGANTEDRINNSVQQLEYAFADAFTKLTTQNKKRVAVIKGNGELQDIFISDFLTTLREYYNIGAITLDSVSVNPQGVLNQLNNFDLALVAKPTEAFTDEEKYILDQYIVNGGKSIWLIDQVAMQLDSLFNAKGSAVATQKNLNLNDLFFKYGLRINPVLVNDLYNTPIVLATGEDTNAQYNPVPWVYHPMVFSKNNHPINTNIEALRLQFANVLDTLPNVMKKTIILQTSPLSKIEGVPKEISFEIIGAAPQKADYTNQGNLPLAVLLEGHFNSAFANRVKPIVIGNTIEKGPENKMLVVADGDIIKNQLRNGKPLELGYDKWTNNYYGNKEFLVNAVNYLLDDNGLINIRNKKVSIPLLDVKKIANQKTKWQLINIGLPIVLLVVFGLIYGFIRKKTMARAVLIK